MTSTNPVDLLTFALSEQRTVMKDPTGSITVELTADGSITAIRLSEAGHRMAPAMVAEMVMSLHTEGLAQAQKAIEAALSDGEMPAMPALDFADTLEAPTPEQVAPEEPDQADPAPALNPWCPSEPVMPSTPPWPVPTARQAAQPPCDQPRTEWNPSTGSVTRTEVPAPPQNPGRDCARAYPEDPIDEDEYFRTFSVFEYDDHNPRG